jgi:hypothetical protein
MSKYHGEQYWSHIRQQTLNGWHDVSEEDLETFNAIRHSREVRTRDQRSRARRVRDAEYRELEH